MWAVDENAHGDNFPDGWTTHPHSCSYFVIRAESSFTLTIIMREKSSISFSELGTKIYPKLLIYIPSQFWYIQLLRKTLNKSEKGNQSVLICRVKELAMLAD